MSSTSFKRDKSLTSRSTNQKILPNSSIYKDPESIEVSTKDLIEEKNLDQPFSPQINPISKPRKTHTEMDRFIPNRKTSKLTIAFTSAHEVFSDSKNKENNKIIDSNKDQSIEIGSSLSLSQVYKALILQQKPLTKQNNENPVSYVNQNLLRFHQQSVLTPVESSMLFPSHFDFSALDLSKSLFKLNRKIPKVPFKVLDAPALQDDFYLNLIDWNPDNMLAVGLASCIYLWSAYTSKVTKLCDLGLNDSVTSVIWSNHSPLLSVGTNLGEVQIWDSVKLKKLRVLTGHTARVGAMAWNSNFLSSGSRDKNIYNRDIRSKDEIISKLIGHKQEVCGLKWSFDEQQLASGGNDNKLYVWNSYSNSPILKFNSHIAAVKAIAWSPHQHGLLASGGGTADRTVRFWNTLQNKQIDFIDTGSQVCNLMFSKNVNELVSTHGYSMNQIIIWKYPDMEKITTLIGHTYRVLYLAMSPNGETIVTGAGDETLRFWNVFPGNSGKEETKKKGKLCENDDLR